LSPPRKAPKCLAALSVVLLSVMMFLGSTSEPPEVAMRDLAGMDDGEAVQVKGVVSDMWKSDSGSESLVLTDLSDNSSAKVVWLSEGGPGPSEMLSIGDEACVLGEVSLAQIPPVLFVRDGDFWLVTPCEDVMSLETLSACWALFEGDTIKVAGNLFIDPSGGLFRLCDPEMRHSIQVRWAEGDLPALIGMPVLVTGVLRMDTRTLSLVFFADDISALV